MNELPFDGCAPGRTHAEPTQLVDVQVIRAEFLQEAFRAAANTPTKPANRRVPDDCDRVAPLIERLLERCAESFGALRPEEEIDAAVHRGSNAILVDTEV